MSICIGVHVDLTEAVTFDCPTLGRCYPDPTNRFKVIALGNRKSADWINLASASTLMVKKLL